MLLTYIGARRDLDGGNLGQASNATVFLWPSMPRRHSSSLFSPARPTLERRYFHAPFPIGERRGGECHFSLAENKCFTSRPRGRYPGQVDTQRKYSPLHRSARPIAEATEDAILSRIPHSPENIWLNDLVGCLPSTLEAATSSRVMALLCDPINITIRGVLVAILGW